jgi:hypothetical protein
MNKSTLFYVGSNKQPTLKKRQNITLAKQATKTPATNTITSATLKLPQTSNPPKLAAAQLETLC